MHSTNAIPAFGLYGEHESFPDLVHCEDLAARAPQHEWTISPHRHGHMAQLFIIYEGWSKARVDDAKYRLLDGDFLFIPALCVHSFSFRAETDGLVISFPNDVVASIGPSARELIPLLRKPITGRVTATLNKSTRMLRDVAGHLSEFRAQQAMGLAHTVLAQLAEFVQLKDPDSGAHHEKRLVTLDRMIIDQGRNGWGARDYAQALAISTGHLSRLCRAATGLGASAYIERKIMSEACRLLAFTQLPVAEVGYRLGYSDPSYFSKRFRLTTGKTPSNYRSGFTS